MSNTIETNLDAWLESIRYMKRYQRLFITGAPQSPARLGFKSCSTAIPKSSPTARAASPGRSPPKLQQAFAAFNDDHLKIPGQ